MKLNFPKVKETRVNGIRVAHIHTKNLMTYTAFVSVCGAFSEKPEEQGISHILEHMLFKGTKKRDMFEICEDAALMGAMQNAYTSQFEVSYHLTAPNDYTEGQIELLSDMMFNSTFPAVEWKKERQVIQEERMMCDSDHNNYFHNQISQEMMCEQWNHATIGYENTIDSITQTQIEKFHKTKYGQDNTVFIVATPVPFKNVINYCKKYFGSLPNKADVLTPNENVLNGERDIIIKRAGIDQSWVGGLFEYGNIRNPKRMNFIDNMITYAIGGGMNSMLFKEVREKAGLCYSVGASKYDTYGDNTIGIIHTQLSPDNVGVAKEKINDVLEDVQVNGITDRQLQAVQAQFLTSQYAALNSSSSIANSAQNKLIRNMEYKPEENQSIINSVTLDEINSRAKEFVGGFDIHWVEMRPT